MVCNNLDLICVVLWTRLRVSFNAYVDPLLEFQVIYQAINPATNDRMILLLLLNDQSRLVLGDSIVFSWASCHTRPAGPACFRPGSRPPFALGACLFIASASAGRHIHPFIRESWRRRRSTGRKTTAATSPRVA
jgi:hypothetical protein